MEKNHTINWSLYTNEMEKLWRVFFLTLLLLSETVFSQRIDQKWLMGYDSHSGPPYGGVNFNFQNGAPIISYTNRPMWFQDASSSICDSNGTLLFYTNGIYIANTQDDTMLNGSGLNPSNFTTSYHLFGLPIPQSTLIIPFPNNGNKYYLFHNTIDDNFQYSYYLYYSIIDMSLDNGLGSVTNKNIVLLQDTIMPGRITATKNANGRDWWLIVHNAHNGMLATNLYIYLITPSGIQLYSHPNIGSTQSNYQLGQASFSQDGSKYAYYSPANGLHICDFDRCNGTLSNPIDIVINDSSYTCGIAFSPNGQYLYVSSTMYIYQFDLLSTNIPASKTTVAIWDGYYSPSPPLASKFYQAALASDNKIYLCCSNSTLDMHVINYPDSGGLACDICQHCIHLPAFNALTIPNYPNYYLGSLTGSLCDSLTAISTQASLSNEINLFPIPSHDLCYLMGIHHGSSVIITDINGKEVEVETQEINDEYLELRTSILTPGVYLIKITDGRNNITKRLVKI